MNQIEESYKALTERCKERGANVMPRHVIAFRMGGITAMISPPDFDALTETQPLHVLAKAVMAVATFAEAATKITESQRLTASAKSEDVAKLARESAPALVTLMTEADTALEAAVLVERREIAPVPIEAADAAQSVVDVELRGILRAAGGTGDQIRMVQNEFAICRAVLRQPTGFTEPLIEYARRAWQEFNPAKQTSTIAQRQVASWRAARQIIGQCQSALNKLSSGRDRMPGTLAA